MQNLFRRLRHRRATPAPQGPSAEAPAIDDPVAAVDEVGGDVLDVLEADLAQDVAEDRRDAEVWVCSSGTPGTLLWMELPNGTIEELPLEDLTARLGTAAPSAAPVAVRAKDLPVGWIGHVVDGGIEIEGPDGVTSRLTAADLPPLAGRVAAPATSWTARQAPRNPLQDREAGERLLETGWHVMPLLDADTIDVLREGYGEVHGWTRAPSALGHGAYFEPDPGNPDFDYRERSTAFLSGVLDPIMRPLFDGFEPFLWAYYCKWPGGEATALHWDWSNVDPRLGHRTYQVWVALEDIDDAKGEFAVLTGSHNVISSPVGSGLSLPSSETFLDRNDEAIAKADRLTLRAGDAVIFDHHLLHISQPNTTDHPRLACAGLWRPAEADLVHFQRVSDKVGIRYRANEWWFRNMYPGYLNVIGPAFEIDEVLFLAEDLEAPGDVGAFLDRAGLTAHAPAPI